MPKIFIQERGDKWQLMEELGLKKYVEVLTKESRAVVDEYILTGKKIPFDKPKKLPPWQRRIIN